MSAPRLVTRALVLSFLTVALVLGAVFTVLSVGVRDQVRQAVADGKGVVVVSGGRQASSWPRGSTIGAAFQ